MVALHFLCCSEVQRLGHELEKSYPELYTNISKQLQVTMKSDILVQKTFMAVAEQMVKNYNSITWGKVIALFALAGERKFFFCFRSSHNKRGMSVSNFNTLLFLVVQRFFDFFACRPCMGQWF